MMFGGDGGDDGDDSDDDDGNGILLFLVLSSFFFLLLFRYTPFFNSLKRYRYRGKEKNDNRLFSLFCRDTSPFSEFCP